VFKIYNKTNDIVKSVITCENLIVYGNRYRTTYKEIDDALTMAEEPSHINRTASNQQRG
ncbi:MAG: hypothetical protein II620_00780, partial [Paludibacteraceae bacterium]|nr:hypothetical protein [Paludibacteraceae bacterium]